ncbi:MAG TPA: hypothetical protein VN721_16680 [Flavipsychrobacter sp.]|nr:hypothetical protein [Flavipsychrobacter sp.]
MVNSRQAEHLRDLLKTFTRRDSATLAGVASDVDTSAYTCSVTLANGLTLQDVQLKALKQDTNGAVLIPAEGSWVQILDIGNPDYLVVSCEVLQKAIITINEQVFTMDGNTYSIKSGDESLFKILNDLLTQILALTVTTSSGPSGTPINATDFQDIQTRLSNLLT